jgi:transcription antitermination factor NusA-like protein
MKAPICAVCLNSDILCVACEKKFREGKISESDVKISKIINELAKNFKSLEEVTIKKIVEVDDMGVIICKKGDASKIIGKGGIIIKKISKEAKKNFKVIEESENVKDFIKNLLQPIPVIRINVLYKPEGEVLKVIIPKGFNPPFKNETFAKLTKILFDKSSLIVKE